MSEQTLWTCIAAVGAVGSLLFLYESYRLYRMVARECPGFLPPQLRLCYRQADVPGGPACAACFARFRRMLFFTLTMLWLALLAVSHNAAPWAWLLYAMMALATGAWIFAMAENWALPAHPAAAGLLGRCKWALLFPWLACMFAGLLSTGFSYF